MQTNHTQPTHISRSAFQWILHQALVADERFTYCGLIGASSENHQWIQKVAMIKGEESIQQTLDVWHDLGIQCLGFFHFNEEEVMHGLVSLMPNQYMTLRVSLSEKGRLDLLAYQHDKASNRVEKVDLDLIEDGQADTVV